MPARNCSIVGSYGAVHYVLAHEPFLSDLKMASKRGRPILDDDRDAAIERRRLQTRERVRQLRQRQREASSRTVARSAEQLQQGEQIVSLTTSAEENAAATLLQLGLRVPEISLLQDPTGAELQRSATDADEHDDIYQENERAPDDIQGTRRRVPRGFFKQFAVRPAQEQDEVLQDQTPLASYFPSLLARSDTGARTRRRVSSPASSISPQTPVAGPSEIHLEPYNNELSVENLAVANEQEYVPNWPVHESSYEGSVRSVNRYVDQDWSAIQPDQEPNDQLLGSEDVLGQE